MLVALTDGSERPLLIDVGANVGDTVLLATAAVPRLHVRAVEGNPEFVSYLHRNTAQLGDRLEVLEKFVQVSLEESITYSHTGSTGGFKAAGSDDAAPALGLDFVSIEELLSGTEQHDLVVWKSDTDGLDLPILLSGWDRIESRCSVIWFEFDPFMDIHGGRQLPELCERIQRSGRVMHVVDNTGRSMMTVSAEAATDVLLGLTRWLAAPSVPGETSYLDIWLVDPDLAHHDEVTGALTLGRAGGRAVGAS